MTVTDPTYPVGHTAALTMTLDTPWGIYAPGNLVLVVAGGDAGGWTIDTDPARPAARHQVDIPADALALIAPGNDEHGTAAGARRHHRRREAACKSCADAMAAYLHRYRVAKGLTREVRVPVELLGALYLNAPIGLQAAAEAALGVDLLDVCVTRHDAADDQARAA
ncbi:hypothetical protein GQ85_19840 [Rhodococcus rhodochrous]|nr:hypothetical protein GQ85_19840 [Rhodococcus rhodochrous]